jgi:hypothetical protein
MRTRLILTVALAGLMIAGSAAAEHDYYKYLRYPSKLAPGIGRDKIAQEGGPKAVGYKRRTVQWFPRKGQDIIDIPKGAPLRVWTRNKGQKDPEALAGISRSWTASDPEKFKAHLVGFRSFGTSSIDPSPKINQPLIPIAVLRMENGELRGVHNARFHSAMVNAEDTRFIHKVWEKEFPKLYAKISHEPSLPRAHNDIPLKLWEAERTKFYAIDSGKDAKYPRWGRRGSTLVFNTQHFHFIANPTIWGGHWGQPANWVRPGNIKHQNLYRKNIFEFAENMWAYIEAAGGCMPFWRIPGKNYKFIVQVRGGGSAGGWMHCGIGDANIAALGHEFGMPCGAWGGYFLFTQGNATQHLAVPGEMQVFSGNFCYPWRNVNRSGYQSSIWLFVLGDNPHWGYGIPVVLGGMGSAVEWTAYHTVARLGQERGLWKNGVRGFGDFFGEYAARMVTVDIVEQHMLRSKYGMPEVSSVYPVYGHKNRYRISNAEAPRWCGYNIIRLNPDKDAKEIAIDFQGIYDPELHSDWRACIVAVDGAGRARYSPLWNKGKMNFTLKPSDRRLWLTVSASPSKFPILESGAPDMTWHMLGVNAPRYPWEATFTGCRPGTPHRMQGDVGNLDELYSINNQNKYLDYPTKWDVPIPLDDEEGKDAQEKLTAMRARIQAAVKEIKDKIAAGRYGENGWWTQRKLEILDNLATRAAFLQRNAKGRRHPNGGGFVSDNCQVAATAYVGPDAMVLDGATVKENACIKEFAVVSGPKVVVSGHAKIGGRAWVSGEIKVGENARILEGATVTAIHRRRTRLFEGQAVITGSAVIKGDPFLYLGYADNQTIAGGLVVDYGATVTNKRPGVFKHGRFYREIARVDKAPGFNVGVDAGALYANWQFNQPKAVLLEDSYVNNNGILYGKPAFAEDGERKYIVFNGTDQHAEAPPTVADFGELTIDMLVNRSGDKGGRLFDFGTGADERFYLEIAQNGKPTLNAKHKGKSYSVSASQGVATGKWASMRIEMDGETAAIYIDGKKVAGKAFAFAPCDVFIGDRPEGNFIGCGRNKKEFFAGKMDHFRIYRKVHDDFDALGPPPFALTQMADWSEKDQDRHDAWEGRRRAKEAELRADDKYVQLQEDIRKLYTKRSALDDTTKLKELETASRKTDQAKQAIDRKIHDELRKLTQTQDTEAEKAIKALNEKIKAITNELRNNVERKKVEEEIRTCEKKRREVDTNARESSKLKEMSTKADSADKKKLEAEEKVKELPGLKKLLAQAEKEKDDKKKRELRDKYNRLLTAKRASDPECQKAGVASRRIRRTLQEAQRREFENHPGRKQVAREFNRLRKKLDALTTRLRESHPELSKLQTSVRAKQAAMHKARKQIEDRLRKKAAGDIKKADTARTAARQTIADERKRLEEKRKNGKEFAEITARIGKLYKESNTLRNDALRSAGLLGRNPHPGADAARIKGFQQKMKYHTTADWDHRVPEEVNDKVPPKLKKWLKDVRGY